MPQSPASSAPDTANEPTTTTLYRAAIGKVRNGYYLPLFTRFEAADKTSPSWNWAAGLFTFNWLLFRQLWVPALVYAGSVVGAALLVFGIGRLVLQFSDTLQWSLLAAFALVSVALPGFYGNGLYHAEIRKRITRALAGHAKVPDAEAQLARQSPSKLSWVIQAIGNAIVVGAVIAWWSALPDLNALGAADVKSAEGRNQVTGKATDAMGTASAPAAAAPSTSSSATLPVAAVSPAIAASSPASAAPTALGSASAPAASASSPVARSSAVESVPPAVATSAAAGPKEEPKTQPANPAKPTATTKPAAQKTAIPKPPAQPKAQPKIAAPVQNSVPSNITLSAAAEKAMAQARLQAQGKAAAAQAVAVKDSKRTAPDKGDTPAKSAPTTAGESVEFHVNAGLFSDENNARNVRVKLQDMGLPVTAREIQTPKGKSVRVRVGPFATQAEADAVADKMRARGLEAAVVQ